jgi:hypothetical protein
LAGNSLPSLNLKLLAVLAKNEPPILKRALDPMIIPLGLSKNKLAIPLVLINPSMLEIELPVTRLIIFWTWLELLN